MYLPVAGVVKTILHQLLIQYEDIVAKDIKQLEDIQLLPKSVWRVYDYLKLFPVTSISHAATQLGSSFNSISNAQIISTG